MARKNCSLVWQNTSETTEVKPKSLSAESAGFIGNVLQRGYALDGEAIVIGLPSSIIENTVALKNAADNISVLSMTGAHVTIVHDYTVVAVETLKKFGFEGEIVEGSMIADHKTAQIIEMALGHVNKKIVSALGLAGCNAIGISGKDGNLIEAKGNLTVTKPGSKTIGFGFHGEPTAVNPEILISLADAGFVTVISPIAFGENNTTYLLDTNLTAAIIASVQVAQHLILLSSRSEIQESGERTLTEIKKNYYKAIAHSQAKRHLEATINALENHTEYVHLMDASLNDAILLSIFSDEYGMKVVADD